MIQFSENIFVGFCIINVMNLLIYVTIYLRKFSLLFCYVFVVEIKSAYIIWHHPWKNQTLLPKIYISQPQNAYRWTEIQQMLSCELAQDRNIWRGLIRDMKLLKMRNHTDLQCAFKSNTALMTMIMFFIIEIHNYKYDMYDIK